MTRTSANFDTACTILLATYDNKGVSLSGHLKRLLSMPPAGERASDTFVLLGTVKEAVRTLTVLERPAD